MRLKFCSCADFREFRLEALINTFGVVLNFVNTQDCFALFLFAFFAWICVYPPAAAAAAAAANGKTKERSLRNKKGSGTGRGAAGSAIEVVAK